MKTSLFPSSKVVLFFFPGKCSNWRRIYQILQHNRSQLGYKNKLYHMQCLGRFLGVFQVNRGSPGDVANCTGILPPFKAQLHITRHSGTQRNHEDKRNPSVILLGFNQISSLPGQINLPWCTPQKIINYFDTTPNLIPHHSLTARKYQESTSS